MVVRVEGFYFLWEEVRVSAEKRGESKGCRFKNSREGKRELITEIEKDGWAMLLRTHLKW